MCHSAPRACAQRYEPARGQHRPTADDRTASACIRKDLQNTLCAHALIPKHQTSAKWLLSYSRRKISECSRAAPQRCAVHQAKPIKLSKTPPVHQISCCTYSITSRVCGCSRKLRCSQTTLASPALAICWAGIQISRNCNRKLTAFTSHRSPPAQEAPALAACRPRSRPRPLAPAAAGGRHDALAAGPAG